MPTSLRKAAPPPTRMREVGDGDGASRPRSALASSMRSGASARPGSRAATASATSVAAASAWIFMRATCAADDGLVGQRLVEVLEAGAW